MLYLARRQLYYSIDEWNALPWWQQDAYVEGLIAEFTDDDQSGDELPGGLSSEIQVEQVE